eukprot:612726-Pleurochrysis_carterae.AAC.1
MTSPCSAHGPSPNRAAMTRDGAPHCGSLLTPLRAASCDTALAFVGAVARAGHQGVEPLARLADGGDGQPPAQRRLAGQAA